MKFKGELFYALDIEADCSITDAIVTPRRISIDWSEGDAEAHLDATSRDGVHFLCSRPSMSTYCLALGVNTTAEPKACGFSG